MKAAPILHIEDNEDDRFFLERAFQAAGIANPVRAVEDGQAAIEYFSGQGVYADRQEYPLPCLVLLDLKLPRVHGLEVLRWLRQRKEFKGLVVIVFSSSPLRDDVDIAYELGANSFLVKPLTSEQMNRIAGLIKDYWLETNEFHSSCHYHTTLYRLGVKPPRPNV